ncbi:MAG: hypothetical protein ACXWNZ_05215 [Vulcanimicrobiaceae bacterium]
MGTMPATRSQNGVFALQNGMPMVRSLLTVRGSAHGHVSELDIVQYNNGSSRPIEQYDADQTQLMHLVIVRDDFRKFMHVHPVLRDGHFVEPIALDAGHRFYAYADSTPHDGAQQVFRFVLQAGAPPLKLYTTVSASPPSTAAGPYDVALTTTHIAANHPARVVTTIERAGRIADDLHPYLGAAAHAVFINASSLNYVHVHPMPLSADAASDSESMNEMAMDTHHEMQTFPSGQKLSGRMTLAIPALPRGTYKMWLQFHGGSSLYVAPFTIVAR